ncbi:hypothetical protein C3942_11615 [Solimonas fluminis]|uniref:histidine kinase n=1 Tax=Solimonas fluminis TaxID=2086571 RepID=A0A2S5TGE1_9GAMM|nr:GAF domain-containing sensor histidine kinase [Solimonas fluminis]PPE74029.1 hypothetical protein C3942_11615 [Solimonas fluminis]
MDCGRKVGPSGPASREGYVPAQPGSKPRTPAHSDRQDPVVVADGPAAVLFRFTDRLYRASNIREVYPAALEAIMSAMGCSRAAILLSDQDSVMRFVAWNGLSDGYRAAVEGHSPWRLDDPNPQPVYIPDVASADLGGALKSAVLDERILSVCFMPLVAEGRLVGKFMAYHDAPHGFGKDQISLGVVVARQLAFTIERQRSAQQAREAEASLREADRRKEEFLAIIAHELRNPLGTMALALDVLESCRADAQAQSNARQAIRRQKDLLARLVNDLLDIARVTQGKLELRKGPVMAADVLKMAIEICQPLLDQKHQRLEIAGLDQGLALNVDPARVAQVLSNLIGNASKFSNEMATIWLEIQAMPMAVEIAVRDEGMGIPAEFLPHIFEMYSQDDRTRPRSIGGLGIGLHLVKRLVDLHGGSVEATSPGPGRGSIFTVRLPRPG